MTPKLIKNLQKLGFTENEARIYAALAGLKNANARKIYEVGGVPRPRVHKVLGRMAEKGYVRIIDNNPILFSRISPEELISRARHEFMLSLDEIFCELRALSPENEKLLPKAP